MNSKVIFAFAAGVLVGASAALLYLKKEADRKVQEEISAIKDEFLKSGNKKKEESTDKKTLNIILSKEGYVEEIGSKAKDYIEPYIIAPEDFGEFSDYDKVSLSYYADGILADDNDGILEHVVETVGLDFFSHFGEYEEDSVFVRNDELKTDYEILLDPRKYSDVVIEYSSRQGEET